MTAETIAQNNGYKNIVTILQVQIKIKKNTNSSFFQEDRKFREENPHLYAQFPPEDCDNEEVKTSERKVTDQVQKEKNKKQCKKQKYCMKAKATKVVKAEPEENGEEWREQFECPVCLEEMTPPTRIHQCADGHLLCGTCRENPSITSCPVCRGNIIGRAVVMEKLATSLFRKQAVLL